MFRLLKNLKWYEWLIVIVIMGLLVGQVMCNLQLPECVGNIVSLLPSAIATRSVTDILWKALEMFGYLVGIITASVLVSYLTSLVITSLMARIRQKLFINVNNFSMQEINKFSIASLITRGTNDITQLQQVLILVLNLGVTAPLTAFLAVFKIVNLSKDLTIINVVSILFILAVVIFVFAVAVPKFKTIQKFTDKINLVTRENLTGLKVVRANSAEQLQEDKFETVNKYLTKTERFVQRILSVIDPMMTLVMTGTSLAIVWACAYLFKDNPEAFSIMTKFTQYSMQIIMGFMTLSMLFMFVPRGMVSAKRINEVLKTKSSLVDGSNISKPNEKGNIVFENVSFKYPGADEYVLENISFEASKGETVAFIGSTGSGKSTLINLIPRFYDCTEGKVLIDGIDVKDYRQHELHEKIGYVPQKGILFRGTIKENILYGNQNASDEKIEQALKVSEAGFVKTLDDGIMYQVAQGGKNVSGGQKQRLSIARAVVRNPEIYIFDDSFSALDYKTDKTLRKNLKKHTKDITTLIVAQRIGTIMNADKIIVLDEGKMVGIGKHKELMKTCRVYQEIALSQLSKEEV